MNERIEVLYKGHGRIETCECFICPEIDWLEGAESWIEWNRVILFKREEIGKDAWARLKDAAESLSILRKQALQLMKQEASVKGSMRDIMII